MEIAYRPLILTTLDIQSRVKKALHRVNVDTETRGFQKLYRPHSHHVNSHTVCLSHAQMTVIMIRHIKSVIMLQERYCEHEDFDGSHLEDALVCA